MSPAEEHRRFASGFTDRVLGTTDWDAPAPVDGWLARDVVRHLVEWFPPFLEAGAGVRLERGPSVDDDPVAAWQVHSDAVQRLLDEPGTADQGAHATRTSARCRSTRRSTGSTPPTSSCTPGTWPGRPARTRRWIPRSARELLAGMEPMDEVLRASGQYGPKVEVPADADVQTRLLGFIGRNSLVRRLAAMKVLVTGGAGYIGSITAKALEQAGSHPGHPRLAAERAEGVRARPDLLRGRHGRPGAAAADRRGAPRPRRDHPHGGADRGAGVRGAALRVLPRQRREVARDVRRAQQPRPEPGAVLQLGEPVRHQGGLRGRRVRPARADLAVRAGPSG